MDMKKRIAKTNLISIMAGSVKIDIPYRAQLDGARPCAASDMRYARMGMTFSDRGGGSSLPQSIG